MKPRTTLFISLRSTAWRLLLPGWIGASSLLDCQAAHALQPLGEFVRGAAENNPVGEESAALVEQRRSEEKVATSRLLPRLSVQGTYSRNQYERLFLFPGNTEPQAFMQYNQFDGGIAVTVPLVNVAAWEERSTSKAMTELAEASQLAMQQDLDRRVVLSYFQLLGSAALRQSAERNSKISLENLSLVRERRAAGMATELDVQRAQADAAHANQDLVTARLAESLAARNLSTLTGVEPEGVAAFPEDDLHAEAPLSSWSESARSSPAMVAAAASTAAAERRTKTSKASWYPTLTGTAEERFTNATALVGHSAYYSFKLTAAWTFDFANLHTTKVQKAFAAAARSREEQQRNELDDAVFAAHSQVESGIEKAKSAREQARAAARALQLAQEQYEAGIVTQLEVLAAQRAAFLGDVARIQADTDLAHARATLRVLAGRRVNEK